MSRRRQALGREDMRRYEQALKEKRAAICAVCGKVMKSARGLRIHHRKAHGGR